MSDEFDDTQNGNDSEGFKNLRKQYEAQKKERDDLAARLAKFEAAERETTVAGILKAKGAPAGAAKFYTGDDASEESVGKWLEDNKDIFGVSNAQTQQTAPNDQNAQQAQRVSQAATFSTETTVTPPPNSKGLIGDPTEMLSAMQTLSYEELVKQGYLPNTDGTIWDSHGR